MTSIQPIHSTPPVTHSTPPTTGATAWKVGQIVSVDYLGASTPAIVVKVYPGTGYVVRVLNDDTVALPRLEVTGDDISALE